VTTLSRIVVVVLRLCQPPPKLIVPTPVTPLWFLCCWRQTSRSRRSECI